MSDLPERLERTSMDIAEARRQELWRLFPEARTEGGKIDFDRLKLALGETVDVGKERYGMNWPGKADCFRTIQSPSLATLRPRREESVNFDTTENLIIEGDNLEVLKLLQKSYLGKVKMIYIDPPYNSGKDLIYPDNFSESLQTYLQYTGQVDPEGRKFGSNTHTDGRFHSKWLSMMYPRLYLARNLLREDGCVFVSVDDVENAPLRSLMNDIFGADNFLGQIIWNNVTDNNPTNISIEHEYIVCYARNHESVENAWKSSISDLKDKLVEIGQLLNSQYPNTNQLQAAYAVWYRNNKSSLDSLDRYKYIDRGGVYTGSQSVHNPGREGYRYNVLHPVTKMPCKQPLMGYRFPEETMDRLLREERIIFGSDHNKIIELKVYAKDYHDKLSSVIQLDGRLGSYELKELFTETAKVFDNPKSIELISRLIQFVLGPEDLVLDFFAGSGTTGHAILDINNRDGGKRKFILVQLPEPIESNDYPTIVEITKERVRRAIKGLNEVDVGKLSDGEPRDRGFRVFQLCESNFKPWDSVASQATFEIERQLQMHVEHILKDRTAEDILYEILLKDGFPLTVDLESLQLAGSLVFSVASGTFLVCLESKLTLDLIRAMADLKPERVVCLDEGFAGNDHLKVNAVQIFKTQGVTSFKTI